MILSRVGLYQQSGRLVMLPSSMIGEGPMRGISTPWALFLGDVLVDILRAAYWASTDSFVSFYLRDVLAGDSSFARASLSAASHTSHSAL